MRRDFLSLVRRPADLLRALRRITVGGAIATTGVLVTPSTSIAVESAKALPAQGLTPTIVDRYRKAAKLLLYLPGSNAYLGVEHRSHRSHSSHRSHVSGSGGGSTAPRPPATPPPATTTPRSAANLDLTDIEANTVSGEVISVDTSARTITIKESATVRSSFAYRDDTKFESEIGVTFRFDSFADGNSGRLPIVNRDKVQIRWRMSADGKTRIVNTIKKTP